MGCKLVNVSPRIFLLSPASVSGERGKLVLNPRASFDLAARLRCEGASLGELYSFISGLYFRGKLAYSSAFASPPPGIPPTLVITPGRGLLPPEARITLTELQEMAAVRVELTDSRFYHPFERDAKLLNQAISADCRIVLLGSVATEKYVRPLLKIFGERLLFPAEFAGRGDMSRGGLMLRCAREDIELTYVPAHSAARHGPRPPKLGKPPGRSANQG